MKKHKYDEVTLSQIIHIAILPNNALLIYFEIYWRLPSDWDYDNQIVEHKTCRML